jgi:hypothetical protein
LRGVALRFATGALSSATTAQDHLAEARVADVGLDHTATTNSLRPTARSGCSIRQSGNRKKAAAVQSSHSVGLMRQSVAAAGRREALLLAPRFGLVTKRTFALPLAARYRRTPATRFAQRASASVQGVYCLRGFSIASDAAVTKFAAPRWAAECHLCDSASSRTGHWRMQSDSDERLLRIPLGPFHTSGRSKIKGAAPDERFVPAQREA